MRAGRLWLARGFLQEARGWLERALAADPPDPRLRADLHRFLGAVLHQAGDLERAKAILAEGSRVAAAAGLRAVQARLRVQLAEIYDRLGTGDAVTLEECEAAAALLESEGDLEGLAQAWLAIGRRRVFAGDSPVEALEHAASYARRSGNRRVEVDSQHWLIESLRTRGAPRDGGTRVLCSTLTDLAEAVYAQGRYDEAQRLTEDSEALAPDEDLDAQARWRATRAKVLARRGQFTAARQLAAPAEALVAPTCWAALQAEVLEATAEVRKLAGAPEEAAGNLRKALRIYDERRAPALADRTRAALASLSADPR